MSPVQGDAREAANNRLVVLSQLKNGDKIKFKFSLYAFQKLKMPLSIFRL